MLIHMFIAAVALFASILTFFSGFGLGTVLLPAMSLFFPVSAAVVMTGIVHFTNGTFKLALLRKHVHKSILLKFGLLAISSAFLGAWLLVYLDGQSSIANYALFGKKFSVSPLKLVVGLLMISFTIIEINPRLKNISISPKYLPVGGIISGFFGGLTGHQGAFRSMFLVRADLTKEQFVATGSAFSFFVDLTRLSVYLKNFSKLTIEENGLLLVVATTAAIFGVFIGNRLLQKVNMKFIRYVITVTILILGLLVSLGII